MAETAQSLDTWQALRFRRVQECTVYNAVRRLLLVTGHFSALASSFSGQVN